MENQFKKLLGLEVAKLNLLEKNKEIANKIVEDLKEMLPMESLKRPDYNSFHIGKIGQPYSITKQTQIAFSTKEVTFRSRLLLHREKVLFDNVTYGDIVDAFSNRTFNSPNEHDIEIPLNNDANLIIVYWLIKTEVLR